MQPFAFFNQLQRATAASPSPQEEKKSFGQAMDEVAFVESLFAPDMRSASSLFPSPPPSWGRSKSTSLVPPPPNSLLGGGISFAQLQTFQPPSEDAPLFVRLHEDDLFSQMLNDHDFPDLHGFKKEKPNLIEPLDLPQTAKDVFCGLAEQPFRARGGIDASLGPNQAFYGNGYNFPVSPAWMQEDEATTPGNNSYQRVHSMKHMMAMSMASSMHLQQPSPGSVDMFNPMAQHSSTPALWISTSRSTHPDTIDDQKRPHDTFKASLERSPFSLTISPPASLIKELIVSSDFVTSNARAKRPRDNTIDTSQPKAKVARTSSSPASQENCSSRANGKVTKGKKCIEAGCTRRAQSNSRCKAHGGGARCQYNGPGGCTRSSQGGGFCRAHGGGKRCEFPGCARGQQRKGRCYVHGGIRKCQFGSCEKKDRGNGFCISHGGGKRCEYGGCSRAVRRGLLCQLHETNDGEEKEAGENVSL